MKKVIQTLYWRLSPSDNNLLVQCPFMSTEEKRLQAEGEEIEQIFG